MKKCIVDRKFHTSLNLKGRQIKTLFVQSCLSVQLLRRQLFRFLQCISTIHGQMECTQTDFLPSNYAFGIMTAERPLTMFLVDQIIMAKLDPIFGLTQVDPNFDLKLVGSSRSEIWSSQVRWALKVGT